MAAVDENLRKAPVGYAVAQSPDHATSGPKLLDRLRVEDIDFSRNEILVRDGKGAKSPVDDL